MISAISSSILCYVGLWFVDDGDIPTFALNNNESASSVASRHQDSVRCWGQSLRVTGGALKHSKCFWYPLNWGHRNGVGYLKQAKSTKTDIYLPTVEMEKPLTKLDPTEFKEVMGLIQNPLGSMKGQIRKMETTISKWMPLVTCNYLPSYLVHQGFWCSLWPSLKYALPCLFLSKSEAESILLPVYKQLLPRLRAVRTLPLVYRYGSIKYFGLGLPHLHHEQTIAKLDVLMMHHMTPTLTQQHIQHSMEHLQVEAGISAHFLSTSFSTYGRYCTKCWLRCLWEDISDLPIRIVVNNMPSLPLFREQDSFIMEYVIS